jgi:proteasome lid subunit RPN8/RPN11
MLQLRQDLVARVIEHALLDHPNEACGLIAAKNGAASMRFIPMINAAASPDFFRFDPRQQLVVWREMDNQDESPLVLYHSHTASAPYPSRDDVAFATDPQAHYLIISTRHRPRTELRSFRILSGRIVEETLTLVGSTFVEDN